MLSAYRRRNHLVGSWRQKADLRTETDAILIATETGMTIMIETVTETGVTVSRIDLETELAVREVDTAPAIPTIGVDVTLIMTTDVTTKIGGTVIVEVVADPGQGESAAYSVHRIA